VKGRFLNGVLRGRRVVEHRESEPEAGLDQWLQQVGESRLADRLRSDLGHSLHVSPIPVAGQAVCCSEDRGAAGKAIAGSSVPNAAHLRVQLLCCSLMQHSDAFAALLVASPASGPPGSPNLSAPVFGRASS